MEELFLTLRCLYRFLKDSKNASSLPLLRQDIKFTQTDFWFCFLCEGLPEPAVLQVFDVSIKRSRTLSNLMNRTVSHSLPRQLYRQMEESLDEHRLMYMTLWFSSVIHDEIDPLVIHQAITDLEEDICNGNCDFEFKAQYRFFRSLRPPGDDKGDARKLHLQAALRLTMLGLHATYGDRMTESSALKRLRSSRLCNPDTLWAKAMTLAPRLDAGSFSPRLAAKQRAIEAKAETPGQGQSGDALVEEIADLAAAALPPEDLRRSASAENAGFYVVSNWLDFSISVNDSPRSTYQGAKELGSLPNGRLVYVQYAPGYQGLRVSPGVWGKISWRGGTAWIPMNLLTRLEAGKKAGESEGESEEELIMGM